MDNESNNIPNQPTPNDPFESKPIFSNEPIIDSGPKKQSGLGIASFIIGLAAVVLLIIAFATGSSFTSQLADSNLIITDPEDTAAVQAAFEELGETVFASLVVAIVCIFGAGFISFVGLILAIIAACSSKRRRLFGVIGIVLNVVVIIGGISLLIGGVGAIAANLA
ncbi:hypothetical protein [Paenibacillus sinopodophylli]|uniref:hypothetical protein n=1 Tax=Paenibacillus sinopodophylli TaxID=1837342 RepID=UPI00110D1F12|nr:hypothetical protein [Paenibacillus sinopodophylli]